MPRGRQLEHPWTPCAGVRSDFCKVLKLFSDSNSVRYEQFAEIWRELKMSFIFTGRDSEKELREVKRLMEFTLNCDKKWHKLFCFMYYVCVLINLKYF